MSEALRIGVVCYARFGGSGVVAAELASGLAARGHRVHVIASAAPGRVLRVSERLHLHVVHVPEYPVFDHAPYGLAVAGAIVEVASAERLDLLHVHYAVPHAASAYLACQVLDAAAPRCVITLHGSDVTPVGSEPSYRAVTRFAVAAADHVTVPSEYLRRQAHHHLDLAEQPPIEVIPNFVDTDHFAPAARRDRRVFDALFGAPADGPVLFHVSNFRAVKRPTDLIDVLVAVRRRVPARLVLVGDGPERLRTAEHARACGVADSVCFLGQRPDFADLLPHADAFLLPSESESFGVAALEALSAGVPVFAYRVGGVPEVVVPEVGVLVAACDVAALAQAVLNGLEDPAQLAERGRAARAHALAHFRRDRALDRYEACFRRVVERSPR
ncbi:MAG: N-acetyl-alpha-D-glucosaminyl L-malate synthase BshA [bacterium]